MRTRLPLAAKRRSPSLDGACWNSEPGRAACPPSRATSTGVPRESPCRPPPAHAAGDLSPPRSKGRSLWADPTQCKTVVTDFTMVAGAAASPATQGGNNGFQPLIDRNRSLFARSSRAPLLARALSAAGPPFGGNVAGRGAAEGQSGLPGRRSGRRLGGRLGLNGLSLKVGHQVVRVEFHRRATFGDLDLGRPEDPIGDEPP